MIILITKQFYNDMHKQYELLVDFAVDEETGQDVIVPCLHPHQLGGKFDCEIGEWAIYDKYISI